MFASELESALPLVVAKGVAAHDQPPNRLIAYESRNFFHGNPLFEDTP